MRLSKRLQRLRLNPRWAYPDITLFIGGQEGSSPLDEIFHV
jgi:hypothetical protein